MSKSVVICAIGKKHCGIPAYRAGMEVWGINDCYQFCPEVKRFYKIFNIHKAFPECTETMPGRYKDWKKNYDKTKALIITAKDLGLRKQRILDITKLRSENPGYCFCSSISYAIFEAVHAGYKEIRLYRLSLNDSEHETQYAGILSNVRYAQTHGVHVYWPWFKELQSRGKPENKMIDWQYGEDVTMQFQYGEINAIPPLKVEIKDRVPINYTLMENMTVKELKKAVKSIGQKIPYNATKKQLIDILNRRPI